MSDIKVSFKVMNVPFGGVKQVEIMVKVAEVEEQLVLTASRQSGEVSLPSVPYTYQATYVLSDEYGPPRYQTPAQTSSDISVVLVSPLKEMQVRLIPSYEYPQNIVSLDVEATHRFADISTSYTWHILGYKGGPAWSLVTLAGELFQLSYEGLLTLRSLYQLVIPEAISFSPDINISDEMQTVSVLIDPSRIAWEAAGVTLVVLDVFLESFHQTEVQPQTFRFEPGSPSVYKNFLILYNLPLTWCYKAEYWHEGQDHSAKLPVKRSKCRSLLLPRDVPA